jgi:hypothetical protein
MSIATATELNPHQSQQTEVNNYGLKLLTVAVLLVSALLTTFFLRPQLLSRWEASPSHPNYQSGETLLDPFQYNRGNSTFRGMESEYEHFSDEQSTESTTNSDNNDNENNGSLFIVYHSLFRALISLPCVPHSCILSALPNFPPCLPLHSDPLFFAVRFS